MVELLIWIDHTGRLGRAPAPVPLILVHVDPPSAVRKTLPLALNWLTTAYAICALAGSACISLTLELPAGRSCSVQEVPWLVVTKIWLLDANVPPVAA